MAAGSLTRLDDSTGRVVLRAGGRWDAANVARLDAALRALGTPDGQPVTVSLDAVERLDTAGAWLIHRTLRDLRAAGLRAEVDGADPAMRTMLEEVAENDRPPAPAPRARHPILAKVERIGKVTLDIVGDARQVLGFFGLVCATLAGTALRPWRLRVTSLVYHIEAVGLDALPIVGLMSLLIGVVLAYQGAVQLSRFGAEIFVVDLIGISVLREIGILLTAIIIAGRSGSAFAAQIGSMMVREEVDAMRTLGLDPIEVLVLPRLLALVIALPLLALFADLMGLLGGGLMAWMALDVAPPLFLGRLREAVSLWSFWVGIVKAPVFGFVIAMIGCLEGMRASGSAESVGRQTTRAVVGAIFLVIVMDAIFSIFFSVVGI